MANTDERPWNGKSRGGRRGYLFFVFVIRTLGLRCAYLFSSLVVLHFIPFAPRATAAIWDYHRRRQRRNPLRACVELYRHYYLFSQTLIDRIALRHGLSHRYRFEFDNYDRFIDLISRSGAVLIGAHVGCWEAGAGFFGDYADKLHIVMLDAEHQAIKEILSRNGQPAPYHIIPIDPDHPADTLLRIKIALNRGEYVCFNGDRHLDPRQTLPAELLGSPVLLPSGPFRIASRCRVPVIFYYAMRERKRTYRFRFTDLPVAETRDERHLVDRYVSSLEEILRRYPRQWFNFYPFWNLPVPSPAPAHKTTRP